MLSSRYWSTSKPLGSESSTPTSVISEPEQRASTSWPDDVAHSDLVACLCLGLEWAGFVLEVVCELEGVSESKDRSVDPVDASYRFLGVPGGAYLPVGVTSVEESTQPGLTPVADFVVGSGEEAAYPIQRVILAASVS